MLTRRWSLSTHRVQLKKARTFRFGNDETLETRTLAILLVGIAGGSLWKGITEFWTDDMPQDATWRPNRHHSNIIPLFRNHVTRNAVVMFPPLPNPVLSIGHGCRGSFLSAVPHTEDAEEKGRRMVLGMSELSNVYSSHHYDPSGTTESQGAAAEAADPSCQQQDTSEEMSTPPGQALGKRHGKGKYVSAVRVTINDKGETTGRANRFRGNW